MKSSIKTRAMHICAIAVLYSVAYLISRYVFDVGGIFPVYTPGWTGRHFLWLAGVISTLPVLLGWIRFPYVTFAGFVLGNIAGELLGGFQSDVPPQYPHYGWFICIVVFLVSCVIGAYIEYRLKVSGETVRHQTKML